MIRTIFLLRENYAAYVKNGEADSIVSISGDSSVQIHNTIVYNGISYLVEDVFFWLAKGEKVVIVKPR